MKILYLQDRFGLGGINKITSIKESYLADKGIEVHNLNVLDESCVPPNGMYSDKIIFHSIRMKSLDRLSKIPLLGRLLRFLYFRIKLLKFYRAIKPNVIVCTMPRLEPMSILWLTRHIVRIQEFHGWYNNTKALSSSEEKEMRNRMKFYQMVALTKREADHIQQLLQQKCLHIPNATYLQPTSYSDCNNKRVLILARLVFEKGIVPLLKYWIEVQKRHPDWQLYIVGDGPEKEKLEQEKAEYGLQSVHICPYTLHPDEEYLKSSIFLLPSVSEGWGLVVVESMSYGVPVVAYDCPCGPSEIIQDGVDGFVTKYQNPQGMLDKVNYLIEHPDVRIEMGKRARVNIQRFNIDDIMDRWTGLFNRLTSESHS